MGSPRLGVRAAPPLPRPSPPAPPASRSPSRAESQSSKAQPERSKKELFVSDLRTRGFKVAPGRPGYPPPASPGPGVEEGGEGGGSRGGSPPWPPPSSASLSTGRLFPPPPSSPPTCSSLRGQGSPTPSVGGRGAAGLTPLPLGLSPLPSPAAPGLARAGLCARARWGEGSQPPPTRLPRRNPAWGGDGGGGRGPGAAVQTCFLPPAAAAARAPVCGCVPRPAHPPRPPLAWRVGSALKGLRTVLQRLGIGDEEGGRGVGQGYGVL